MVWTGWAISHPSCMDRLRKNYSHLVGGWFLASKAAWALSGCMTNKSANYCMLVKWVGMVKSRVCLLRLQVDLSSVLESELGNKIFLCPYGNTALTVHVDTQGYSHNTWQTFHSVQSHLSPTLSSGVARSLVLAGHLLYASCSCALRARSRDMSGTNVVLLARHMPSQARPPLRHWSSPQKSNHDFTCNGTRLHCALVNEMKTYCFSRNTRLNIRQAKAKRIPRHDSIVNTMNTAWLMSTNCTAWGTPPKHMNTTSK